MHQGGEAEDPVTRIFRYEKNRAEALFEGVVELLPDLLDLMLGHILELPAHDRLDLFQSVEVDGQNGVVYAADKKHGLLRSKQN